MDAPYGSLAAAVPRPTTRAINWPRLLEMHAKGEKIAALAAHDASFAGLAARSGIECILVREDPASMNPGHPRSASPSLDVLAYHVSNVSAGLRMAQASAWVVCDLPESCCGSSPEAAMRHAIKLLVAGAQMLRMPIDEKFATHAAFLSARGVVVSGHLKSADPYRIACAIQSLRDADTHFLFLEGMGDDAVSMITRALPHCVVIGRHAGQKSSGQLLSLHALLGMGSSRGGNVGESYLSRSGSIEGAMAAYVADVKANTPALAPDGDT